MKVYIVMCRFGSEVSPVKVFYKEGDADSYAASKQGQFHKYYVVEREIC